jgi:hypothetical protein
MSGGSAYDVRHPEMAYVTASQLYIALEVTEDDLPDRVIFCDPIHVTRVEPLDGVRRKRRSPKKSG